MYEKKRNEILKVMKKNIKIPLTQNQIDVIFSYLWQRGANPYDIKGQKALFDFYKAINEKNVEGILSFMFTPKPDYNNVFVDGVDKRMYQSARYILGDNTEDELLKAYDKPLPFK